MKKLSSLHKCTIGEFNLVNLLNNNSLCALAAVVNKIAPELVIHKQQKDYKFVKIERKDLSFDEYKRLMRQRPGRNL